MSKNQRFISIGGEEFKLYDDGGEDIITYVYEDFIWGIEVLELPNYVVFKIEDCNRLESDDILMKVTDNECSATFEQLLRGKFWSEIINIPQYARLRSNILKKLETEDYKIDIDYEVDNEDDYNHFKLTVTKKCHNKETVGTVLSLIETVILDSAEKEIEKHLKEIDEYINNKINNI